MFDRRSKHLLTPSNAPYLIIGLLGLACFLGLTICNPANDERGAPRHAIGEMKVRQYAAASIFGCALEASVEEERADANLPARQTGDAGADVDAETDTATDNDAEADAGTRPSDPADIVVCWGGDYTTFQQSDAGSGGGYVNFETIHMSVPVRAIDVSPTHWCTIFEADRPPLCFTHPSREDEFDLAETELPAARYVDLAVGNQFACFLTDDGQVHCAGRGSEPNDEPIRHGGEGEYDFDQAIPPEGSFQSIDAGNHHVCGLRPDDTADCWGLGDHPELEYGGSRMPDRDFDQARPEEGSFATLSSSLYTTCGLRYDGDVDCWGEIGGTLGDHEQIGFGFGGICTVTDEGPLHCSSDHGSLHEDLVAMIETPKPEAIAGGQGTLCVLRHDRRLECVGEPDNDFKQDYPP